MKCLNPISINYTPDYETEFNGRLYLPCGKCEACRNNDSLCWRIRLKEEFYNSENAYFVTLTYDDSKLNFEQCFNNGNFVGFFPTVNKKDIQKFFKRFRKHFENYYKEKQIKFSYFLVSEYGPTSYRPHYHAILFNLPVLSPIDEVQIAKITKEVQEIWSNGFIRIDKCNEQRIGYCTKYMSCETVIPTYLPKPFRMISKGIGKCYLNNHNRIIWHRKDLNNYYPDGNRKFKLPRYYKDKIFSDDEKEMIYQLNQERVKNENLKLKHNKMTERDARDFSTSINKFKRDYKNKSLKNRKF